jgi:DNA repair photolyase
MLNESKGNMYEFVTHTWNVIKGKCPHDCEYCYMKIFKQRELHFDRKELETDLGTGNFIFVGSSCDMFAEAVPNEWIESVLKHCNKYPENQYLFQSKNPERVAKFLSNSDSSKIEVSHNLPKKSVIGTTIETNRVYKQMGNTISPQRRAEAMRFIKEAGYETMVTLEPIMDFDLDPLLHVIEIASPNWVNIGADSKGHKLPEPTKEEVLQLVEGLRSITTVLKKRNLGRLGIQ